MSPASYRAAPPRVGSARLLSVVRQGKSASVEGRGDRGGNAPVTSTGALPRRRRLRSRRGGRGRHDPLLRLLRPLEGRCELLLRHPVGREVAVLQRLLPPLVGRLRLRESL